MTHVMLFVLILALCAGVVSKFRLRHRIGAPSAPRVRCTIRTVGLFLALATTAVIGAQPTALAHEETRPHEHEFRYDATALASSANAPTGRALATAGLSHARREFRAVAARYDASRLLRVSFGVVATKPGLSAGTRSLSEAHLSGSGETVLGHYADDYIGVAQKRGASYFDIGGAWDPLSSAQRTAANNHFLDKVIQAGDRITFATPKANIRVPSALADEVAYLRAHGYDWVSPTQMVKR
jgi:hypothetical protein